MVKTYYTPPPVAMPEIQPALLRLKDVEKALNSAKECWNKSQLIVYIETMEKFLAQTKDALN